MEKTSLMLFTDGGSRGNPGPAGIGFVIFKTDPFGKLEKLDQTGKRIGIATNNVAEYTALIEGLTKCQILGALEVSCFLDSLLVVCQLTGKYKIKDLNLQKLCQKIKLLENNFKKVTYTHIPREKNHLADSLVNKALDGEA